MVTRPVLIIGPLNDVVTDKLISDFPHKFSKCEPKLMNLTQEALEKGIMNNIIVDFKRRGSQFECYTLAGIKEICERVSILVDFVDFCQFWYFLFRFLLRLSIL